MAIATKRNKYGLDPFQICFPSFQKHYGKGEQDSAWPLIMRTMFNLLYADKVRDLKKAEGKYFDKYRMPGEIAVPPRKWAWAFNVMCTTLREADPARIERPTKLDLTDPDIGNTQVITLLAEGKRKVREYRTDQKQKNRTRLILARMEKHMKSVVGSLPEDYEDQLP